MMTVTRMKVVLRYECRAARAILYFSKLTSTMPNHTYSTFLRTKAFHDYNGMVCGSNMEAISRTKRNMNGFGPFILSKS
jgi:hypothetical protein